MKRACGFSLMELMVAVVVVGILAGIAYPSYRSHLARGHRAGAQQFMLEIQAREEQHLLDGQAYIAAGSNAGISADLGLPVPARLGSLYTFSVALTASPPGYIITAAPVPGSAVDSEPAMTLSSTGARTPPDLW